MITGETVYVVPIDSSSVDDYGNPIEAEGTPIEVENVVVAPGATSDSSDADRPDGVTVAMTLHFPKTFTGEVKGHKVKVRGKEFSVIGNPQRYTSSNVPGEWDFPIEVQASDG